MLDVSVLPLSQNFCIMFDQLKDDVEAILSSPNLIHHDGKAIINNTYSWIRLKAVN